MFKLNTKIDKRFLSREDLEAIKVKYFMPVPATVSVLFTDYEVDKMKRVLDFAQNEKLSQCSFYCGWYAKDPHQSERIQLFDENNNVIPSAEYEDFNTKFKVFNGRFFKVRTSNSDVRFLKAEFLYVNSWSDYPLSTLRFSIEDLAEVPNNY